jgi:hypothetical protein
MFLFVFVNFLVVGPAVKPLKDHLKKNLLNSINMQASLEISLRKKKV